MARLLGLLGLLFLAGCAALPEGVERVPSQALDGRHHSRLGQLFDHMAQTHPGDHSAFYLLGNGLDAFVARAALARLADEGIDLQYYMIHDDHVGTLLLGELVAAADRGVRVRILLDDIDEGHRDFNIAVLDRHPNIEVRLFNPFGRNVARLWQYFTGFGRQTRRAHNKSFTVDKVATILGGRNIGDEYFERDPELAFQDLDVLALGPVAGQVADSFDRYWNHPLAYPIGAFVEPAPTRADYERLAAHLKARLAELGRSAYLTRLRTSELARRLASGELNLAWAPGQVVADPPDKLLEGPGLEQAAMLRQLEPYLDSARRELIILSPYFVPGKAGLAFFERLRARGVRVRILTNSLASTDVSVVHAGYIRYRKALLRMGVELWELDDVTQPQARKQLREGYAGKAKTSLHAKAFVVDRRYLFVGSLNLDPRSVVQNTEIGVVIDSPALAGEVAEVFDRDIAKAAFRLTLVTDPETGAEAIRWHRRQGEGEVVLEADPNTGFLRRLFIWLMRWLPLESQI